MLVLGQLAQSAEQITAKEEQLKAIFLWRLAQFVDWPADAFGNEKSPLVIGILGDNPFGSALESAVRGETAHGRKLVVRYFQNAEQASPCHIVYIAGFEPGRINAVTTALRGRNVLTVSDAPSMLREGGMVRFVNEGEKMKLRVDLAAVRKEGLTFDGRLLRIAEVTRAR
jgi:hypothetical protein